MGYIWTPQMADNLRWLMCKRHVEPIDLTARLGYKTAQPVRRMMRLMDSDGPYRPHHTERVGKILRLPYAGRHHWAMPSDQFHAWVAHVDTERNQWALARGLGPPRKRRGFLRRWIATLFGFRIYDNQKGRGGESDGRI